jgi:PAS domain S-box-containing protein
VPKTSDDGSEKSLGLLDVPNDGIAQARLAAIVESSDDAIISKDLAGVITTWNAGAERMFGYTAAEAIGQPVTMLIPADRYNEEPGILRRIRQGERIDHYQTVRIRKDGSLVDISLSVFPVTDAGGVVVGASKIARDITREKRADEQRAELLQMAQVARGQAEAANRSKDEFLAMLGHELRNPLFAVRNSLAAAMLDPLSRDRALEIARRQTDQLGRIVDDLLDVARINQGRVPLKRSRLPLAQILKQSVDAAQTVMVERRHALALTLPEEEIVLNADPDRLEQVFGNLLANAAKYTHPGGTITVTATREADVAVISVQDNGIGIAQDLLPRMFDLFRQGERALDRAQGGLGIGLTLVRSIVQLHGGSVEAKSGGVGTGSEFIVRLPALPSVIGAETTEPSLAPQSRARHSAARVLMVEDNPDSAESFVMILELLGHHVRLVHDGSQALEAAHSNVPDVMLIDIGLPGMDGYELAAAVRNDPALKHLVLVAITGYGREEDKHHAMAAGFDYHLVKPIDLGILQELVDRSTLPGDAATRH